MVWISPLKPGTHPGIQAKMYDEGNDRRRRASNETEREAPPKRRLRRDEDILPLFGQFSVPRPCMPRYRYPEPELTTGLELSTNGEGTQTEATAEGGFSPDFNLDSDVESLEQLGGDVDKEKEGAPGDEEGKVAPRGEMADDDFHGKSFTLPRHSQSCTRSSGSFPRAYEFIIKKKETDCSVKKRSSN